MSAAHLPTDVSRSLANWHELLIGQVMSAAYLPNDKKDQESEYQFIGPSRFFILFYIDFRRERGDPVLRGLFCTN